MKPTDPTPDLQQAHIAGEVNLLDLLEAPTMADPDYLHWQKLKHLQPPHGWDARRWWFQLKWQRSHQARPLPLLDVHGRPLTLVRTARMDAQLRQLDLQLGGRVALPTDSLDAGQRDLYVVSSLMQEAIHSSLYEGAVSTVEDAKQLLRSGRTPRTHSEQMIWNSYQAMQHLRTLSAQPLRLEHVLELHRMLTDGTLDDPADAGRIQVQADARVRIVDRRMHRIVHIPPPAATLPERLARMVAFANAPDLQDDVYIHPLVRAILLHYQLAHDHPFADGNGRTARALFYWCLLNRGYWLAEFLSISRLLYRHRGRYEQAFVAVQTDGGDATYFVLHQLRVLIDAVQALHDYAEHRQRQLHQARQRLQALGLYNARQQALLEGLLRAPGLQVTHQSHARTHAVTHVTARADLQALCEDGLLHMQRIGRQLHYRAVVDLESRLR